MPKSSKGVKMPCGIHEYIAEVTFCKYCTQVQDAIPRLNKHKSLRAQIGAKGPAARKKGNVAVADVMFGGY